MSVLEISFLLLVIACLSSLFGVLTGLGGGILIVPILSLFHVELHYAMGASLISIIMLSLSVSTTQSSHEYTNFGVGVFLECGAVIGAILGALLLPFLPVSFIKIIFGIVLLYSAYAALQHKINDILIEKHHLSEISTLQNYSKIQLSKSWCVMTVAGILSGILGIGSGVLKVTAMEHILRLPYKVSTATSNFMVGITATASIGIYFSNEYIDYRIIFPVIFGVFIGAHIGSKILKIAKVSYLKILFVSVVVLMAIKMFYQGVSEII